MKKIKVTLVILSLATLSVSCTREVDKKSFIQLQLPQTGQSFSKSSLNPMDAGDTNDWSLTDPASYSEIDCYAVFVSSPSRRFGNCLKSDKTLAFPVGFIAGLFPAGGSVQLEVPAGPKTHIRLVGLKSQSPDKCFLPSKTMNFSDYSAPFIVGQTVVDLAPSTEPTLVNITASLSSHGKFFACQGPGVGFGPPPEDIGDPTTPTPEPTTPPPTSALAVLTGAPGTPSNTPVLNITVGGTDIVSYQYKLGEDSSTDCSVASGYSSDILVATNITDSLSGFSEGPLKLCVLGKTSTGEIQDLTSATNHLWIKDTTAPSVSISAPVYNATINSGNASSFAVSGVCSEIGQSINISGSVSTSATCTGGTTWSASIDYTGAGDGAITLTANHMDMAGNVAVAASTGFFKDTVAPSGANIVIELGAASTTTTSVTISLTAVGATDMYITNTVGCTTGGTWETQSPTKSWVLAGTNSLQTVYVKFRDSAANESVCVSDTITHAGPALLSISDGPTYDFGTLANGGTGSFIFTLTNSGGTQATAVSDGLGLATPYQFVGGSYPGAGGDCGSTLNAGSTCQIAVEFSPSSIATFNDTIDISYNDGAGAQNATRDITGTAVAPAFLSISPSAPYNFGTLPQGGTSTNYLTVTNGGSATATGINESGLASPFQFVGGVFPGSGGTCSTTLTGSANCTINIEFTPTGTGPFSDDIDLNYNNGVSAQVTSYQVQGTGVTPASLTILGPGTVDFGNIGEGFQVTAMITISNSGGYQATGLAASTLTGGTPYDFLGGTFPGTGGNCGPTLGNSSQCHVAIEYSPPSAGGPYTSSLVIEFFDGAATQNVIKNMTGSGFAPYNYMALGNEQTCFKNPNGNGYCVGRGLDGNLGNNANGDSLTIQGIFGGHNWLNMSAYTRTTCGVDTSNNGYCWGANSMGQVGDNTTTNRSTPTALPGGSVWNQIQVGNQHSCGIKTDGSIHCWGRNNYGQLGDGTTTDRLIPVAVTGLSGTFTRLAAGAYFNCALKSDGSVWCWGQGNTGQMGNGSVTGTNSTPVNASILGGTYLDVTAGSNFACALHNSGGVAHCWGGNSNGQLGDGSTTDAWAANVSVGASGFTKIVAGNTHMCGYNSSTKNLKCWGQNTSGQLGDGTTTNRTSPVNIGANHWADVFVGYGSSCGLTLNGETWCWGNNANGQLATGAVTGVESTPLKINP